MISLRDSLRIGAHTMRSRIAAAPMERNSCTSDGHLTDCYRSYLGRIAQEGVGLVCVD